MGGATNYTWLRLQHDRKTPEAAHEALTANWLPQLAKEGAGLWGAFPATLVCICGRSCWC